MNRTFIRPLRLLLLAGGVTLGACATAPTTAEAPLACLTPAARNPPAHLARDSARHAGPAPTLRDPPPAVLRGFVADDGQGGPVGNPTDPQVARGNRAARCAPAAAAAHSDRNFSSGPS